MSRTKSWQSRCEADVAVVGAGIVGLAHALAAARDGCSVVVFERDAAPVGASIRNFGMIWPIGQPSGKPRELALQSRSVWLEIAQEAGLWINACGSIHLAHREDELAVLEEFCGQPSSRELGCRLLSKAEVESKAPAANPNDLLGGMWSPAELCIDPREVAVKLTAWLHEKWGVEFRFGAAVQSASNSALITSAGQRWKAGRIVVANGSDFESLFPEVFRRGSVARCKLQMMRTVPQPGNWRCGPHLAGGLTLRHYACFAECPSLANLKRRIADEKPELEHYGIHVMASQNQSGEVVLGDSHEYSDSFDPFCKEEINSLILREVRSLLRLKDWTIAERWYGIYAKYLDGLFLEHDTEHGIKVVTGFGGAGMTLSFAAASDVWRRWTA